MRPAILALIAALATASFGQAAAAQTPADRADARCILVLGVASRDPNNKEAAGRGTFYFLGRLEARGAGTKLESLLLAEGKEMTTADQVKAELTRCGGELGKSNTALATAYQHLAQQTQQAQPPAQPVRPPSK